MGNEISGAGDHWLFLWCTGNRVFWQQDIFFFRWRDIKSYNSTVDTTVRTMLSRATALFNVAKYQKCLELMSAVNNSDSKSSDSINLACEANIMLLISKIKTISVSSIEFSHKCAVDCGSLYLDLYAFCGGDDRANQESG